MKVQHCAKSMVFWASTDQTVWRGRKPSGNGAEPSQQRVTSCVGCSVCRRGVQRTNNNRRNRSSSLLRRRHRRHGAHHLPAIYFDLDGLTSELARNRYAGRKLTNVRFRVERTCRLTAATSGFDTTETSRFRLFAQVGRKVLGSGYRIRRFPWRGQHEAA
jgi:hypothetical protein